MRNRYIYIFNPKSPPFQNIISKSNQTYFLNFCKETNGEKITLSLRRDYSSILPDDQSSQLLFYAETFVKMKLHFRAKTGCCNDVRHVLNAAQVCVCVCVWLLEWELTCEYEAVSSVFQD